MWHSHLFRLHREFRPICQDVGMFLRPIYYYPTSSLHVPVYRSQNQAALFCTASGSSSSNNNNNGLPPQIEQKCREWEQAMLAEQKARWYKRPWIGYKMKFKEIAHSVDCTKLHLYITDFTHQKLQMLNSHFPPGHPVELNTFPATKIPNRKKTKLTGNIATKINTIVIVNLEKKLGQEEENHLKSCTFDMRKGVDAKEFDSQMEFLRMRNVEWKRMPGYEAMLGAYKCQGMPDKHPPVPNPENIKYPRQKLG